MSRLLLSLAVAICLGFASRACGDDDRSWPALPEKNGEATLPAQEWPARPGPREIKAAVYYPGGSLTGVGPQTGLMLSLHNWGGSGATGTADPARLAERFDVVAITVDYLQSGQHDSLEAPEPYDYGYLQGLDALRALWWVRQGLQEKGIDFADGRVYAAGGSGGGNVTLMVNKLAPRTFACAIDLSGMPKLSDDIAFHLPGGSDLDARWSRDPASSNYLSPDAQEFRFVGCPEHLDVMRRLGTRCNVIVVHGVDDTTCPTADAREMVENMEAAGLDVEPHFVTAADLDGRVFKSTDHSLGDRTQIVFRAADRYLLPDSPKALVRHGPPDFDCPDAPVVYRTSNGRFVISYEVGYPVGRFEPAQPPVKYDEHQHLTYYLDEQGQRQPIRTTADWEIRRRHILANLQAVMGPLPGPTFRVPLDVQVIEEARVGDLTRRKITYQTDPDDQVTAWFFTPDHPPGTRLPAVLCLHQTTKAGKDEPAGLAGNPDLHNALELAQRGYVTLAPDYPSFGEHAYDFDSSHGYVSGSMKAVWDNIRAVDLLQTLDDVDPERIGCIGHSLGGHNTMFTAAFEPRIKAIVSSCGFCTFQKDDVPSWTGPVYMPRIANLFNNDAHLMPFDFTEIVAAFAPRPFFASAAQRDSDFDVNGVRDVMGAAESVYDLLGVPADLEAYYPDCPHSFPPDARQRAYDFLDQHLKRETGR